MPRAKKSKLGMPSLLPGSTFDPNASSRRYGEVAETELREFLQDSLALERAATERVCRKVDMWYNNILRTVPMEELLEPFNPADREQIKLPDIDAIPLAPTVASGCSSTASTSADKPSLASAEENHSMPKQTRRRVAVAASTTGNKVAVKKKLSRPRSGTVKHQKVARKASTASHSFHTPLATTEAARGNRPIVTPKFDIRKRPPVTARAARQGETLLSLSGSPVVSKPAGAIRPVHVHVRGGKVVKVKADADSDENVKELCRGIEKYCAVKK